VFNTTKMAKATNACNWMVWKARRMVNALTRIDPDLVPLWTNLYVTEQKCN